MTSNGNYKRHVTHSKDLLTEEQQNILRNKGIKIEKIQSEIVSLSKPLLLQPETYKHITPNTLSVFQDESSWRKVNRVNTDFKFKELKSAEGLCSWNSLLKDEINLDSEDDCYSESSSSESSQTTTKFDVKDMKMFGSMPMEEETIVVKCNNCKRPFLPSRFKEHAESCLGDKLILIKHEEKELVSDDERSLKRRWESGKKQTIGKKKQKNKKEKAPLDLDKQCGVIQTATNMPCTRSITCKTHSMGAKRSVKGRSQSYDLLLAAYQKKTIGRPNVQEQPTNIYKVKLMNEEHNLIDSDDEMDTVMEGVQYIQPLPLAEKSYHFLKRKRQCFRMKGILLDAITPKK